MENVDAAVTEVRLLWTLDTTAFHVVLIELSLTIGTALPHIPLLLKVSTKATQLATSTDTSKRSHL